ncbi:alpha,alpha-trehalase nth1 [Cytospora paraplurivora]|uniref:Endonuclease III homolog n=1 Tax=Cytospora paraplurivora TaxID=2898453 RepID=A0AAN9UL77_9PEZI
MPLRRITRASLARFAYTGDDAKPKVEETTPDIEDILPSSTSHSRTATISRKRKRAVPASPQKAKNEAEEADATTQSPQAAPRRARKPARKAIDPSTGAGTITPPSDWEEMYNMAKEMRLHGAAKDAPVDTMGCERLALLTASPRDQRFHTLVALMLSSQTKDTTNAVVVRRLQAELPPFEEGAPPGLNLENVLAVEPARLNEMIWAVGFHNNKTRYLKQTAEILRDQWKGDIPDTIEGLVALPGVGPKMAHLCLSSAWGRTEGIGVDVHVHRITNLWGWHKTKTPEETRLALESWLPRDKWREINWLLVGLGQTVCAPVGRKCGDCELGLGGLCKAADRGKVIQGRKLREAKVEIKEDVNITKLEGEGRKAKVEVEEDVKTVKVEEKDQQPAVSTVADAAVAEVKEESKDESIRPTRRRAKRG